LKEFPITKYRNERILTTGQIAEAYETTDKIVSQNFIRNKEHFVVGKHYFLLEGADLKAFKRTVPHFEEQFKQARYLYLWTKRGAAFHAKTITTQKAWEFYEDLVDFYFEVQEAKQEHAKKKPLYLQRREANADREIDGMWSVIDFLDQLSHKVRFDLFDISEKSCPDGSYGKSFMRFLRGEIDCGIPLPPNFSLKQIEQHPHIVCLNPHCERKVNHFPNLIKGYAEEFWRSWYVPNKLEEYLKGKLPDGTPRCSSIDEVHRIMDAIVFPNKKRMR
jgi:phage regulator Rha-like protein